MIVQILSVFGIVCIAWVVGRLAAKVKLPAILGWLVTGVVFGPYLVGVVSSAIMNALWYKIFIKVVECFAGVMIGKEIIFKKLAKTGKQIVGITFIQSIGTFLVVSLVFAVIFLWMDLPVYLAFVFGGIALATAPAPALSIVNEYRTSGPVTQTLIPLAAIDDVIGVVVFFSVISIIGSALGGESQSFLAVIASVCAPFVVGIGVGFVASFVMKRIKNKTINFRS
ncbi:MAG: cation:proton antiporter, partial [Gemmiger sp.]